MNNFTDFLEAYSLSKICKIGLEYTLKCSQVISSSDNKKILLTTKNVRLDSGRYASKILFFNIHEICMFGVRNSVNKLDLVTPQDL